jgi:hypothetical protein
MTNTQLFFTIGIPSVLVLVGILLNQLGQGRVETRLLSIEGDLRRFYQLIGEHGGKIEILEKKP